MFDFCISIFAIQISKIPIKGKIIPIILASIVEAIVSVIIIIFVHKYIVYLLWSILFGVPLLTIASVSYKNRKQMKKLLINMYIVAVILAGTILMLENITGRKINYTLILFISLFVAECIVIIVFFDKRNSRLLYEVILTNGEHKVQVMALYDSGNRLKYQKENKCVHIVSESIIQQLGMKDEHIQIEYKALGINSGKLDLYRGDKIEVFMGKNTYEDKNVFLGKADNDLLEGKEYQMILNGDIFL